MLAAAFLAGLVLALALTPLAIRIAWALGYLDHPEARKLHTSATALLGGVVVFVAALAAWIGASTFLSINGTFTLFISSRSRSPLFQ